MVWIGYGMVWLSMAIVVSVAMIVLDSTVPLWLMILPALIKIKDAN